MKSTIEPNRLSLSYLAGWETALINFDRWTRDRTVPRASTRKNKPRKKR